MADSLMSEENVATNITGPNKPSLANAASSASKASTQLKKLQEANAKYKSLLMLAKERIQQQEEELEAIRAESLKEKERALELQNPDNDTVVRDDNDANEEVRTIVRICQILKAATRTTKATDISSDNNEEIWALFEIEVSSNDLTSERLFEWKNFESEAHLQDYTRRDFGEPLVVPPYCLSVEESCRVTDAANRQVHNVSEDFRRFRVRAELARKQTDVQIRELKQQLQQQQHIQQQNYRNGSGLNGLQSSETETATVSGLGSSSQLERLKAELAAQENHWKEAYDMLLAENDALKSNGSEALLASQWRQRYETCCKEKTDLENKLQSALSKGEESETAKLEAKYKDLKESFRLYRKKAKEIFEAQERGGLAPPSTAIGNKMPATLPLNTTTGSSSSSDAKLNYLKNLMVNYLSTEQGIREHMEGAIATVLNFSPNEMERIKSRKKETESWF